MFTLFTSLWRCFPCMVKSWIHYTHPFLHSGFLCSTNIQLSHKPLGTPPNTNLVTPVWTTITLTLALLRNRNKIITIFFSKAAPCTMIFPKVAIAAIVRFFRRIFCSHNSKNLLPQFLDVVIFEIKKECLLTSIKGSNKHSM